MTDRTVLKYTRALYKGDVFAGSFYLLAGIVVVAISVCLYYFTQRLGLYYLAISMAIFSVYLIGKGCVMIYMYRSRHSYYKNNNSLSSSDLTDEKNYTEFRISKKNRSRRVYIYVTVIGSILAFLGIFHQETGLIIATCIPIVLMSGMEFGIGLLTEFRLSEYLRQLNKV